MVALPPPAVSFAHLPPGWHAVGGESVATSWPYRPGDGGGWADHMPVGGIAVTVFFPTIDTHLAPIRLVLPRKAATLLEGTTDTPEYRIEGSVHGRDVFVWVDIRTKRPTAAQLHAAQQAVSAVRFGG